MAIILQTPFSNANLTEFCSQGFICQWIGVVFVPDNGLALYMRPPITCLLPEILVARPQWVKFFRHIWSSIDRLGLKVGTLFNIVQFRWPKLFKTRIKNKTGDTIVVIALWCVIGLTMHLLSIKHPDSSKRFLMHLHYDVWLGCQRSKYGDVDRISRATCHVYRRNCDIKIQCRCDKEYVKLKKKV